MIKLTDHHGPRLQRIAPQRMTPAIGDALLDGAEIVVQDAIASILDGAISGAGHVPSAPGEAPNADTHDLDRHIHVGELIEFPGEIRTSAISDSDHAWIERGGVHMAERPYIQPAVARNRAEVIRGVARAISRVITG